MDGYHAIPNESGAAGAGLSRASLSPQSQTLSRSRRRMGFLPHTLEPYGLVTPYARDLSALLRLQNERLLGIARRISTVGFCFVVGGAAGGFCLGLAASVSGTSGIGVGGGVSWAGP